MPRWTTLMPLVAAAMLVFQPWVPMHGIWVDGVDATGCGEVLAAVHHAEVVAHQVGEPFGTLVLALAITVIEVALIVSLMLAGGSATTALARDTVYATLMIITTGVVGLCVMVGGVAHREQAFRVEGAAAGLGALLALAVLLLGLLRLLAILLLALLALLALLPARDIGLLLPTYTQVFMKAMGGYLIQFFPLFLLGAVFGKLMEDSGSAAAIAQGIVQRLGHGRAILAVVLACAILTYGGVSLFVVAFAVYPIGSALFREAQVPKRLVPATIALGAFTFTMTAMPGTPAIQNAIPMPYFGTTPFAAPGLGVLASLVMGVGGWAWLAWRFAQARGHGEGYGVHDEGSASPAAATATPPAAPLPLWVALSPILAVLLLNLVVGEWWLPRLNTAYLAEALYGPTRLDAVRGVWAIIVALCAAIALLVILAWRRLPRGIQVFNDGVAASVMPMFNTASLVGFGAVVASLSGFGMIRDVVMGLGGDNVLVSLAIVVNVLAGITGSASGGMSIALAAMADQFIAGAEAAGIPLEVLHRVASMASGGMDTLPHNGAVITLLAVTGLTHREAYGGVFKITLIKTVAVFFVIALYYLTGLV